MTRYKVILKYGGSKEIEVDAKDENEAESKVIGDDDYSHVEINDVEVEEIE